jgi:hypothetical protein
VIPEKGVLSSEDRALDPSFRPPTPGGQPIPKTMVEETPDVAGSTTHPGIERRHQADPPPDLILKADGSKVEDNENRAPGTDV